MAEPQPLWLKVVTRLERVVGEQVEKVVRSDTYFDLVSEATRNQRRIANAVEGVTSRPPPPVQHAGEHGYPPGAGAAQPHGAPAHGGHDEVEDLRASPQDLPRTRAR